MCLDFANSSVTSLTKLDRDPRSSGHVIWQQLAYRQITLPSLKQLFRRWLMRPLSEFLSDLYHLWPVNYKCDVNICCMLELY